MADIKELREKLIHAMGLCVFGCDGINHKPAMDKHDERYVQNVMELIDLYTKDEVEKVKADIAYAIGHAEGSGSPIKYLEKRYPELASLKRKQVKMSS